MADTVTAGHVWTADELATRVVRYDDLRPCRNAFIDTRSPGSEAKENFTIIGPGVSENPDQYVHIVEAHGFNIGGARQPSNCVNSQHSHDTAEVFVVHSGRWRFDFGETGKDASLEAEPGDIVSFPIHVFRGFENIGEDIGFLWSVLGGDNPGRVLWAPHVFELARNYGLVLLDNGALIDTTKGETPPPGVAPMPATTPEQVEALRRLTPADGETVIVRAADMPAGTGETPLIGNGGPLAPTEGFTVARLLLDHGRASQPVASRVPEVVFVQDGAVEVRTPAATITLRAGDTMTVPVGLEHSYANVNADRTGVTLFIVRGR